MRFLAEAIDRFRAASKIQFSLDLANICALVYLGYFAYHLGMRPAELKVTPAQFYGYAAALVYTIVHRYFLKDLIRQQKWDVEYGNRKVLASIATNQLSDTTYYLDYSPSRFDRIERTVLEAIKSYAESVVFDIEGVRLFVTLIVEDWDDPDYFVCLNRATSSRAINRYRKAELQLALAAWEGISEIYEPNAPQNTTRKNLSYKTVLILPIAFYQPNGPHKKGTIGLLSIDSTREDHFGETLRARLKLGLLPYIALLRSSLLLRRKIGVWPQIDRTGD